MSTNLTDVVDASPKKHGLLKQIGQKLRSYVEMPPTDPPTLPEAWLARTRLLAALHSQAQRLNILRENAPVAPILSWSLGVVGALIGGIVVSAIFIDPGDFRSLTVVITYSALILAAALVLVFSKAPASLISQLSMFRAVFLFVVVAAIGTFGFVYLENWTIDQSLYATIITMTTVGYGDLTPSHSASRYFAISLSLVAVGIAGYAVSSVAAFIVEGNVGRLIRGKKIHKQIGKLDNHIILCGAGQVGKQIAIEFYKTKTPFVVIERNPAAVEQLQAGLGSGVICLEGDATEDEILKQAGIERARGFIAALSDDKDNIFAVLSARSLNPDLRIVARVNDEDNTDKLRQAGADVIVAPNTVGGMRMASEMVRPEAVYFLDQMLRASEVKKRLRLTELPVDEIKIPALESDTFSIADIGQHTELLVMAVKHEGQYRYKPRGNTLLHRSTESHNGDMLVVIGTQEELDRARGGISS